MTRVGDVMIPFIMSALAYQDTVGLGLSRITIFCAGWAHGLWRGKAACIFLESNSVVKSISHREIYQMRSFQLVSYTDLRPYIKLLLEE